MNRTELIAQLTQALADEDRIRMWLLMVEAVRQNCEQPNGATSKEKADA